MPRSIDAGYYNLGWIGKSDAAILALILLDTYGVKTAIIDLLPFVHAVIQSSHGMILEVNEISLIHL
jgi:hypothetical protein